MCKVTLLFVRVLVFFSTIRLYLPSWDFKFHPYVDDSRILTSSPDFVLQAHVNSCMTAIFPWTSQASQMEVLCWKQKNAILPPHTSYKLSQSGYLLSPIPLPLSKYTTIPSHCRSTHKTKKISHDFFSYPLP